MNRLRVSFLVATKLAVIATLVSVLSGCVTTPEKYRNGDFVSHMASSEVNARTAAPPASFSAPRA